MLQSATSLRRLATGLTLKKTLLQLITADHKGGLVAILGLGFLATLPLMLISTPEEKQHLIQNTMTVRMIEQHLGPIDITRSEHDELKSLLLEPVSLEDKPRQAWLQNVIPEIQSFGVSLHDAESIARWVWLYAKSHDLNPALLLALITIESRFDPYAVSSVGAQGLMQVMPFWKRELGSKSDNLFDVATNIRYGSAILKHYLKRYHTEEKALAAYNGSRGRVKYPNKVFSQLKRFEL